MYIVDRFAVMKKIPKVKFLENEIILKMKYSLFSMNRNDIIDV